MKTRLRMFAFSLALVFALVLGYVAGSIRGARLEGLHGRILRMYYAYAVADAVRAGRSDTVFPDSRGIAHSLYPGMVDEPWLQQKLLIPVVEWERGTYPLISFGISDEARNLTARVGRFLSEAENQSNRVTTANGPSPRR